MMSSDTANSFVAEAKTVFFAAEATRSAARRRLGCIHLFWADQAGRGQRTMAVKARAVPIYNHFRYNTDISDIDVSPY